MSWKNKLVLQKISIGFLKYQGNVINNVRENGSKTEDGNRIENGEMIDNVYNRYIDKKYQYLVN